MRREDFTIEEFNSDMKEALKGQGLSFGALVLGSLEKAVSITAEYCPPTGAKRYITLDRELNPVEAEKEEDWYYGASPRFDNELIIDAVSKMRFSSLNGVDSFIKDNCSMFMLHADQAEYLPDFARYLVLSVASLFGIKIKMSEKEASGIKASPDYHSSVAEWKQDEDDKEKGVLALHGCPPDGLMSVLSGMRFSPGGDDLWRVSEDGLSIVEIYSDPRNLLLLGVKVFYSGVLFKPVAIEKKENRREYDQVESCIIKFERATFAAVYALDRNYTEHPLFRERKARFIPFLISDDEAKIALIRSIEEKRTGRVSDYISEINVYLDATNNVNQIGVSANVICSGGELLMGRRGKSAIDNGTIYPSVNGNAELSDRNVSFYGFSVYEDNPTLYLDQVRMDFLGEISREAYAELKLDLPKLEWHCYGMTISGSRPGGDSSNDCYTEPFRRMHFNLLFEQCSQADFQDVLKGSKHATESFENENLFGLRVKCHKNFVSMIWNALKGYWERVGDIKDVIESLLVLVLALSSLFAGGKAEFGWSEIVMIPISAFIIVIFLIKLILAIIRIFKSRKKIKTVHLYFGTGSAQKNKKLRKICQKLTGGSNFHPAAYASVKAYVDNLTFNSFFSDDGQTENGKVKGKVKGKGKGRKRKKGTVEKEKIK